MNAREVNQILTTIPESVCKHLLPNGRKIARNWCVGSVNGEAGESLRICLEGAKSGIWSDFADGNLAGDLLELWKQVRGLSFIEALKEAKEFAGISDVSKTLYSPVGTRGHKLVKKPRCQKPDDFVLNWFENRGIFQKTLDTYKVGQQGKTVVFSFLSPAGEIELVKYRDLEVEAQTGKKKIWSNKDPEYHLFGWQALTDDDRSTVICEGEIDALTWAQAGYLALSVPTGGGDGAKQTVWLDNDFDRLERFETIFISMDMDEPGQKAIQPIISRLGPERCKVVNLGEYKDVNEAYTSGALLQKYIESAQTIDPSELRQLVDHHHSIIDEFENSDQVGLKLPWLKTHNKIRLRPGEISVWAGINSHGKSLGLSHIAVEAVARGERVCIASMEMPPRKLGRKMYQQITASSNPTEKQYQAAREFLADQLWLFECHGTAKAERIIEVFRYARKRYGVTHFVVDSLAKCGFGEDSYNEQKNFVDQLMEFAGKNNCHGHLVVHVRKSGDENRVPGKWDIKGTGAISDMVDNCFIWWRNKAKEQARERGEEFKGEIQADAVLNCVKQRETGEEPMVGLYFHRESLQFLDNPESQPKHYV